MNIVAIKGDEMKAEDINHIRWIHDRLVYVYKENENVDFLIKLRSIITELEALQQPKSCEGCVDAIFPLPKTCSNCERCKTDLYRLRKK